MIGSIFALLMLTLTVSVRKRRFQFLKSFCILSSAWSQFRLLASDWSMAKWDIFEVVVQGIKEYFCSLTLHQAEPPGTFFT
jgi:hypothetical protein